jgi:hypothetical protein
MIKFNTDILFGFSLRATRPHIFIMVRKRQNLSRVLEGEGKKKASGIDRKLFGCSFGD